MITEAYSYLPECLLKHCYICGCHHGGSGLYCHGCLEKRYELVTKDAEIRCKFGDLKDHRFWASEHAEQGKDRD